MVSYYYTPPISYHNMISYFYYRPAQRKMDTMIGHVILQLFLSALLAKQSWQKQMTKVTLEVKKKLLSLTWRSPYRGLLVPCSANRSHDTFKKYVQSPLGFLNSK